MMLCGKCSHVQVGRTSAPPETKQEVCEYFDEVCEYFDVGANPEEKWAEWSRFWGDFRKPAFLHILHTIKHLGFKSGRLLDVGSAFGHFLDLARREGYDVFGVDISDIARQLARDKFNIETFKTFDDIPTSIRSFDIVVCSETLYYQSDVRSFLGQMRRVLKPSGILVLKMKCNRTVIMQLASMLHRWRNSSLLELRPGQYLFGISLRAYHLFRTRGVHRLLRDTGFRIVRTVNETSTLPLRTIPQFASVACSSLVNAISMGKIKIGKEITVYAVPSSGGERRSYMRLVQADCDAQMVVSCFPIHKRV